MSRRFVSLRGSTKELPCWIEFVKESLKKFVRKFEEVCKENLKFLLIAFENCRDAFIFLTKKVFQFTTLTS